MLLLSAGIVYWLQALLQYRCDNNVAFSVEISSVYANSPPQKIGKKQNQSVHTHTAFLKIVRLVHERKDKNTS